MIARGPTGSFDAGCILHVGNPPLLVDNEVWVYYSAIYQLIALIVAEDQRIERCPTDRVAADNGFLPLVHRHFLPCAGAQARLIFSYRTGGPFLMRRRDSL